MERGKKNIEQRQVAFEQQLKATQLYTSKPIAPDLTLNTDRTPLEECANVLFREVVVFLGLDS